MYDHPRDRGIFDEWGNLPEFGQRNYKIEKYIVVRIYHV